MSKLSPEAAREKYLYNKKYQESYWERRAAKSSSKASKGKVAVNITIGEELLPDIDEVDVSISRQGKTDERYIKQLEQANKTLNSENRRLIKLLTKYQELIRLGIQQLAYENEIF